MEALQNKITEYFNNIDARYMVYDKLVKEGSAQWMTPAQYPQWLKGVNNPGVNAQLPYIQKFVDEGRMLAVSQQRWTEDIVPLCDDIFIAISKKLKGNIVGVAEDGIQTWELDENGNLLPVDPKLKKKYVKKGLNYYNQE